VALSGVKSPCDLYILLPDDLNNFTICPAVNVVQILKTMQSSRPLPIPQISPGDNIESGIASFDPSEATLSGKFLCPDDYFDTPHDQIRCVSSLDHDAVEILDPYPAEIILNAQIMSRFLEEQQVL
jgi:hypothetical protein